ncbi:hypothetical protein ATCC90586_003363 [Pythium insidiosum]|nr:hypothetical protein ATCC90586_003363 [Pythium insidiosum]
MTSLPPRHDVPHVQRRLAKAARLLTFDAVEHARRQRQFETLVLSQIFERAERHRRHSLAQGKTPLGRSIDSDVDAQEAARWRDARAPISLLELLQAAPAVLKKHGVAAPDDELFHRYLLSLSTDPTPDWRVKLLNFSRKHQPRVTRLCRAGAPADQRPGDAYPRAKGAARVAPLARMPVSPRRATQSFDDELLLDRRPDDLFADPEELRAADRFGDVLATQQLKPLKLKENKQLNSPVARSPGPLAKRRHATPSSFNVTFNTSGGHVELAGESSEDDELLQTPERVSTLSRSPSPSPSPSRASRSPADFGTLALVFQQWKELAALHRLRREHTQREIQLRQAVTPPSCTLALFRWIALTLPERHAFAAPCHAMPAFVLRRMARLAPDRLTVLQQLTHDVTLYVLHRILATWRDASRRQRACRVRALIRRRTAELALASQALAAWHVTARRAAHVRVLALAIQRREQRRLRRRSLATWRTRLSIRQRELMGALYREKKLRTECFTRQRRQELRALLAAWRAVVSSRRTARRLVAASLCQRATSTLRRAWLGWTAFHAQTQALQRERLERLQLAERRRAWTRWRRLTSIRRICATLFGYEARDASKRVLLTWRRFVERRQRCRSMVYELQRDRDHSLLTQGFQALRRNLETRQLIHAAVRSFMAQRQDLRCALALRQWRELVARRRSRHERCARSRRAVEREIGLRRSWRRWRDAWRVRDASRLADLTMRILVARHALGQWRRVVLARLAHRQRIDNASAQLQQRRTQCCVKRWQRVLARKRCLERLTRAVLELRCRYRHRRAWRAWRDALHARRRTLSRLQDVVRVWQHRRQAAALLAWRRWLATRRQHRQVLATLCLARHERVVARCFQRWAQHRARQIDAYALVVDAEQHHETRRLRRAIAQWRARTLTTLRRVTRLSRAVALWSRSTAASTLRRWRQFTALQREKHARRREASQAYDRRLRHRAWRRWRRWWQLKTERAARQTRASDAIQRLSLRRAVRRLQSTARRRARLRALHGVVSLAGLRGRVARGWAAWRSYVATTREQRHRDAQVANAMAAFRLACRLNRWHDAARLRRLLRSTWLRAESVSRSTTLQQRFKAWQRFVHGRRLRRALQAKAAVFQASCLLPSAFHAWRAGVCERQRQRALLAMASQRLLHGTQRRAFDAWKSNARRARSRRRAMSWWTHQSLRRAWAAWASFQAASARARELEDKAASWFVSRRQRRVLQLWRDTTTRQRVTRHAVSRWRARVCHDCLRAWQTIATHRRLGRALRKAIDDRSKAQVLRGWRQATQALRAAQSAIRARFLQLWRLDAQRLSLERWKSAAARCRRLRASILRRLASLTLKSFTRWRSWQQRRQRERLACQRVQRLNATHELERFWRCWRARHDVALRLSALCERWLQRSACQTLAAVLATWRRRASAWRRVRLALSYHRTSAMAFVLRRWRRFQRLQRQRRERVGRVERLHQAFVVRWLQQRLRQRVRLLQHCEALVGRNDRQRQRQRWRQWRRFTETQRLRRHAIEAFARRLQASPRRDGLRRSVGRWRCLPLARALEHWRQQARDRRWSRVMTGVVLERWQLSHSRRSFELWRRWSRRRRQLRVARACAASQWLRRCWRRWLAFRLLAQRRRRQLERAVGRWRLSALASRWARWRLVALSRRRRRLQLAALQSTQRTTRSRFVLRAWRSFAAGARTRRAQLAVSVVLSQQRALQRCWRAWQSHALAVRARRRALQQQTERLQVLELCSAFRAWRCVATRQRTARTAVTSILQRSTTEMTRRVLQRWAAVARARRAARATADAFRWAHAAQHAVALLRAHAAGAVALRAARERARAFAELLSTQQQRASFGRWRRFTRQRQRQRAADERYRWRRLLPACWRAWRAFVARKRTRSDAIKAALLTWTQLAARRAWTAWVHHHALCRRRREQQRLATQQHETRLQRQSLGAWRRYADDAGRLRGVARRLVLRWQQRTVARTLDAWRRWSLERRTCRTTGTLLSAQHSQLQLATAWRRWRFARALAVCGARARCRRVWRVWAARCARRAAQRAIDATRALELQRWRQRRVLGRWRTSVTARKQQSVLVALGAQLGREQRLRRSFERWLQFLVARLREKTVMRRVVAMLQSRRVVGCWRALREHALGRRARRERAERARRHWTRRLECRVLLDWRRLVVTRSRQRAQLSRYVSLLAWRAFSARRRELRARTAAWLVKQNQLSMAGVFATWKAVVAWRRRKRLADRHSDQRRTRGTWRRWQRAVLLGKIERMLGASSQRILERTVSAWRRVVQCHRAARELRSRQSDRERRDVVRRVLLAWRQWSHVQSRIKQLLACVAVGNHRRYRFLLWRQFTAQRQRVKRLVLGDLAFPTTTSTAPEAEAQDEDEVTRAPTPASVPAPRARLERHRRVLQRFLFDWTLAFSWQQWRHAFHARLFHRMRVSHRVLTAWRAVNRRRRLLARVETAFRQRSRRRTQSLVLGAWRGVVVAVRAIQRARRRERELWSIVQTEMARRERRVLQTHWRAWRGVIEERRHLEASLQSYRRARVLTKFWLLWAHDGVARARLKRAKAREIETAMTVALHKGDDGE